MEFNFKEMFERDVIEYNIGMAAARMIKLLDAVDAYYICSSKNNNYSVSRTDFEAVCEIYTMNNITEDNLESLHYLEAALSCEDTFMTF